MSGPTKAQIERSLREAEASARTRGRERDVARQERDALEQALHEAQDARAEREATFLARLRERDLHAEQQRSRRTVLDAFVADVREAARVAFELDPEVYTSSFRKGSESVAERVTLHVEALDAKLQRLRDQQRAERDEAEQASAEDNPGPVNQAGEPLFGNRSGQVGPRRGALADLLGYAMGGLPGSAALREAQASVRLAHDKLAQTHVVPGETRSSTT